MTNEVLGYDIYEYYPVTHLEKILLNQLKRLICVPMEMKINTPNISQGTIVYVIRMDEVPASELGLYHDHRYDIICIYKNGRYSLNSDQLELLTDNGV